MPRAVRDVGAGSAGETSAAGAASARAAVSRTHDRLAALHRALADQDPDAAMDAYAALAHDAGGTLTGDEYRGLLRVILRDRPHAPATLDRVLMVIQDARRAFHASAQTASATDQLVAHELADLLQAAYVWNALLTGALARCAMTRGAPLPLQEALDWFLQAEAVAHAARLSGAGASAGGRNVGVGGAAAPPAAAAAAAAAAPARAEPGTSAPRRRRRRRAPERATSFPDVVSYNLVLQALVRSVPARRMRAAPLRARALVPSSFPSVVRDVRAKLQTTPWTPALAERCFEALWAHMASSPDTQPSSASWCLRIALYTRLRRLDAVHASVAALAAQGACTLDVVHAALRAYHRLTPERAARAARVRAVYEALRYRALCAARGQPPSARPDATVRAVLGVAVLPPRIVPTRSTYTLVLRLLADAGDLRGALHVMHDMVVSEGAHAAPTMDVYHVLFANFARYGTAARRAAAPSSAAPSSAAARAGDGDHPWHQHALMPLLDGYLRSLPAVRTRRTPRVPPRAPPPRALAALAGALRRVSGGDALFVQTQWARVAAHFGAPPWRGFRETPRVRRALSLPADECPRPSSRGDSTH